MGNLGTIIGAKLCHAVTLSRLNISYVDGTPEVQKVSFIVFGWKNNFSAPSAQRLNLTRNRTISRRFCTVLWNCHQKYWKIALKAKLLPFSFILWTSCLTRKFWRNSVFGRKPSGRFLHGQPLKYANLWHSCRRRPRGCLSSMMPALPPPPVPAPCCSISECCPQNGKHKVFKIIWWNCWAIWHFSDKKTIVLNVTVCHVILVGNPWTTMARTSFSEPARMKTHSKPLF